MIAITDNSEYFNVEITQELYDSIIKLINFKKIRCTCGQKGTLVKIGTYPNLESVKTYISGEDYWGPYGTMYSTRYIIEGDIDSLDF